MRDAKVLQQSIEYLEQSNLSLAAHTQSLEEARREVLQQVNTEKDLLRIQERDVIAAKHALETLQSGSGEGFARTTLRKTEANDGFRDFPMHQPSDEVQRPT